MRFVELYNLIFEEDNDGHEIVDKEFANRLGIKGEKVDSGELYKVARDIRQHPGDYSDLGTYFFSALMDAKVENDRQELYIPNLYDSKRKIYLAPNDSGFHYFQIKADKKLYLTVIQALKNIVKQRYAHTVKYYNRKDQWANVNKSYVKTEMDNINKIGYDEFIQILGYDKMDWTIELKYDLIDKFPSDLIREVKYATAKVALRNGDPAIEDNDSLLALFNYFDIKTPDINNYLTKKLYGISLHPSDIDKKLVGLGDVLLDKIYKKGITPVQLARRSCAERNGGYSDIFAGAHGILNVGENDITKKEAYEWLIDLSKKRIKQTKFHEDEEEKLAKMSNMTVDQYRNHNAYERYYTEFDNFPTHYIEKRAEELGVEELFFREGETYDHKQRYELTFQDMNVFRWFLKNMKSVYFWKEQTAHGPANQHRKFKPIDIVANITAEDLINGVKTSPEIAFRTASERIAKRHVLDDKIRFDRYNHFEDTEKGKVLRTQGDLNREHDALGHCVQTYGHSCLSGRSFIVSLPQSTAELDPTTLKVYQHRGFKNRTPPEEDVKALHDWIEHNKKNIQSKKGFADFALEA